jgi:hypothetical protein
MDKLRAGPVFEKAETFVFCGVEVCVIDDCRLMIADLRTKINGISLIITS